MPTAKRWAEEKEAWWGGVLEKNPGEKEGGSRGSHHGLRVLDNGHVGWLIGVQSNQNKTWQNIVGLIVGR